MKRNFVLAAVAAMTLSACISLSAVPAGTYEINSGASVTLDQAWSSFPKKMTGIQSPILSKDGLSLNQLIFSTTKPGEPFLNSDSSSKEYPMFEADMSLIKQVEFIKDNLSRMDFEKIKTKNVTPRQVGGRDGVIFDLTGQYKTGLNFKGKVALAQSDAGLNSIIFIAPEMYYFDRDLASVEAIIDSASFP